MSPSEIKLIKELGKDVRKLLMLKETEWLTANQVKAEFNIGKKFLQDKRKRGILKNFRCLPSGKNFQYQRSEIEKLFTTIKN